MSEKESIVKERSVVGDIINFRGMIYSPINEQGVVYLFSKVAEDLNMYIEEVKSGFPDCIARRFNGRGWEKVYIEFEFTSCNFKTHGHPEEGCDIIVCWEHDWDDCPLEVFELKSIIKELPNRIPGPEKNKGRDKNKSVEELLKKRNVQEELKKKYYEFEKKVFEIDPDIWEKVGMATISFSTPKRLFLMITPFQKSFFINIFTRGEPLEGVKPSKVSQKWGGAKLRADTDIDQLVEITRESWKRINEAVKANEQTGWGAKTEADEEDAEDEELED